MISSVWWWPSCCDEFFQLDNDFFSVHWIEVRVVLTGHLGLHRWPCLLLYNMHVSQSVGAIATHGIFSGNAIAKIQASDIEYLVVSDSCPVDEKYRRTANKIVQVSWGCAMSRKYSIFRYWVLRWRRFLYAWQVWFPILIFHFEFHLKIQSPISSLMVRPNFRFQLDLQFWSSVLGLIFRSPFQIEVWSSKPFLISSSIFKTSFPYRSMMFKHNFSRE